MSIGVQLFNDKGELFYDSDYSDSVMSLTERRQMWLDGTTRDMDMGVPANIPCVVFFRIEESHAGRGHGLLRQANGRWLFSMLLGGGGATITLYIFSTLPQPNPAPNAYGVQLFDTAGNIIIHNNSKPLSCNALTMQRDTPVIDYPYITAVTPAFLGAARLGGQNLIQLFHSTAVGTKIARSQTVVSEGIGGYGNYHSSVLVLNAQLYD